MALQIYIASDHNGYDLKNLIIEWLNQDFINRLPKHIDAIYPIDMGPNNHEKCDYPYYAHMVSKLVSLNKNSIGIVICGTGTGMSIVCNRYDSIRCALCHNTESAKLARQHNNANVLSLGAKFLSKSDTFDIIEEFILNDFEGGRHENRINQINKN